MASFHGKFRLGLVIIYLLFLAFGNPVDQPSNIEQLVLEKSSILNGVIGAYGGSEKQSICAIENSSCGFQEIKQLLSCEEDLKGIGSLNTTCQLNTSLQLQNDVLITGDGNLEILPHVSVHCPVAGCLISINISGDLVLGEYASLISGTLILGAKNLSLQNNSCLNTTSLGGAPPPQTSGTPLGIDGAGGGHGGRGACCIKGEEKDQEDTWGGDDYAWSSLTNPWSYGSKGGTTTREKDLGGGGGGRVKIFVMNILDVKGSISADGGDGGLEGGGGSGGSINLLVHKLKGTGEISACGGNGWAGGGGGRISINCYSRQESVNVLVHGGESRGCTTNAGAAGTIYDAVSRSLTVSNNNFSTFTDTLLYEFPTNPLWTDVYVKSRSQAVVPLRWSRVQVRGQIGLYEGTLSFGLSHYPFSEFELIAQELLMSDSTIKVYGALRMSVKMLLMLNSKLRIDGGGDETVGTSLLETSNLVVLKGGSVIRSNSNLGIHGQGYLQLSGSGDAIEAQRLILSLFYNINVGPGSTLQAPLDDASDRDLTPKLDCENSSCPMELIHPPEDCNVNTSLSFTLQICRVEDIIVNGIVKGSVIHVNRARTVTVNSAGLITASGLGCRGGFGKGQVSGDGAGGGAGHGGRGGDGVFNVSIISEGGEAYGNKDLPCELGSGSGNSSSEGTTAGGGIIVMGSMEHSLSSVDIFGSVRVDGESNQQVTGHQRAENMGGSGGGSGGSLLLFLDLLTLGNISLVSSAGGHGGHVGGGGGGGGRIHFHWSNIATGDEYAPLANVGGTIYTRGGMGSERGHDGMDGTITGKECPEGLFGIFCEECPVGTFKNGSGSSQSLCWPCPLEALPRRAQYISVRGGVTQPSCPYRCISDKYHMPFCYTPLEELIYTFGGPWLFGLLLSGLLVILALVLSVARMKFVGADEFSGPSPTSHESQIDHSFPFLESLNEVMETNRAEESQSHVHRMYFMGPNTFGEPWHLPHSPPEQIIELVYEDAFNRFVDEINSLTAYQWWEGSVYSILSVLAYPFAWSWQQWRRKSKVQRLREFVRSEYDHSCLRSCRSRALYEGLKVTACPDLIVAYIDFYLGGDEKRPDLPPRLLQRLPMSIIFGGDGSYMAPYFLHSDNLLTSLLGQAVPATMWYRFVAGLNAYLRTVRQGCIRSTLLPVIHWLGTHANPTLSLHGIHVHLAWFQATTSGYYQLGVIVNKADETHQHPILADMGDTTTIEETNNIESNHQSLPWQGRQQYTGWSYRLMRGGIGGGSLNASTLQSLEDRKDFFFPLSLILRNTRPVGHQDLVGLIISILLLGDFSLVLLTLLQFYSISLAAFLVVLSVLPLALLSPFPAGINALFSHGPKRSAGLARVYALWNVTSLSNVVMALICGFYHYKFQSSSNGGMKSFHAWNFSTEETGWWLFPTALLICKCVQARLVDWHIANLEIQDRNLYSKEPAKFWES